MATTFLNATAQPQPGDGAYLLQQSSNKKPKRRKKLPSFLRQKPDPAESEVTIGNHDGGKTHATYLRATDNRKERTTSFDANDQQMPRTIAHDEPLSSHNHEKAFLTEPQVATFLRRSKQPAYTLDHSPQTDTTEDMAAVAEAKALPPHRRPRKTASDPFKDKPPPSKPDDTDSQVGKQSLPQDASKTPVKSPTPGTDTSAIVAKLATEHGVKVSPPKPAPSRITQTSTTDGGKFLPNGGAKIAPPSSAVDSKRGHSSTRGRGGRGRGRGRGNTGRQPRESPWPTHKETRADPKRWDIRWESDVEAKSYCSSVDSVCANAGFGDGKNKKRVVENGIDPETGFKLMDWSGRFAPAPIDWDARPAFRDGQSAQKIMSWMDVIDEQMCGKEWAIPVADVVADGIRLYFAPDAKKTEQVIQGDSAPRYWIPVVFGNQAPQTFWVNEIIKSNEPEPYDENDLFGVKPWWEMYQVAGGHFLKPYQPPTIIGVDPDEDEDERLARENDYGSNQHTENRKRKERAKLEAQRERRAKAQKKVRKVDPDAVAKMEENQIKPAIKLYIRSAKPDDIPRIREIYNHYVSFSVCTPETQARTLADMHQRLKDVKSNVLPFLVACERGGKIVSRRKKHQDEDILLPDKVVGFAMADDYNDMQGMYRFTAEIEVYTDKEYYMKGVAKCLLDKLMAMLDPRYIEKGGYEKVGHDMEGEGEIRRISNLVVNLPYDKDSPVRLEWIGRWLSEWLEFENVGDLKEIGLKDGKSVNLAIFQRKTGEHITPQNPPVIMSYPPTTLN